jgi:hypothetical protein
MKGGVSVVLVEERWGQRGRGCRRIIEGPAELGSSLSLVGGTKFMLSLIANNDGCIDKVEYLSGCYELRKFN